MKLFTKADDKKLFAQYAKGSDLDNQDVVVKIFNPYGNGTWFIMNSDPDDPDYLWGIADLGYGAEIGSISRSDLENYRNRFGLGFEKDTLFRPTNANELYKGLRSGKTFAKGGKVENLEKELRRLQRELNSQKLGTYREGDNSKEAKERIKEREEKLNRFHQVLKELRETEKTFAKGGETSKNNFTQRRKKYLESIGEKESKIWDKFNFNSGSEIRGKKENLKKYAEAVEEMLQKEEVGKGSFDRNDYDYFTDENWHLFNEFLVWNGYYDVETTEEEKKWRLESFTKGNVYISDPEVISLGKKPNPIPAPKSREKTKLQQITDYYVVPYEIEKIVTKDGKTITNNESGVEILSGAVVGKKGVKYQDKSQLWLFEKGGLPASSFYLKKENIDYIVTEEGDEISGDKLLNGFWIDNEKEYSLIQSKNLLEKRRRKLEYGGEFDNMSEDEKIESYKSQILRRAVLNKDLSVDEATSDLAEELAYENAEELAEFAENSGEVGSSDFGYFYKSFLKDFRELSSKKFKEGGQTKSGEKEIDAFTLRMVKGSVKEVPVKEMRVEEAKARFKKGGQVKINWSEYYKKGGVAKNMPPKYSNGERKIDTKSIKELTDYVNSLPQTKTFHFDESKNEYTPERKKLHAEIINGFKKDVVCITKGSPIAILMGGSPASGKSSFLKKYSPFLLSEEILKIDADEIRAKLPEYKGWNATQTHLETKDIVNTLIGNKNIGIPCDFDLIYDGTMNSVKSYIPLIELLKKRGYKVFIVYMDNVPKNVIEKRVLERYKKAGRFVPLEVVDDFFSKGKTAFNDLKKDVDGYMIVDGSSNDYKIIEKGGMSLPKNRAYSKLGEKITEKQLPKEYAKGGTTFKEKSTAIAKKFVGKKVEPKYQKEYGKTYDKKEAQEVGNKIAGSQKAKYDSKMGKGGTTKRGGVMLLAKQIRKDGESWASAMKRAGEQLKKK